MPAPGVPETHRLFAVAAATGRPVQSEFELAYRWEQQRAGGPRPLLAVTGTDGKTTTTLWAVEMLAAGGVRSVAAGNTDVPLVAALDLDVDAFVVECTSFRLAWTERFRGDAAAWLNLAPDHLNWHASMATYEAAKARIFSQQRAGDVAIGFADDAAVMAHLGGAPGRRRTFAATGADYHVAGGDLVGPQGALAPVASLRRALPHDLTNGLAATALVLEAGLVGPDAVAAGLASFVGPPHRIELVGDDGCVRWFNDSKATTPHAASAAIRAFDHVVLIAGGLNKGLDLAPMAAEPDRLRAVVAVGEAAGVVTVHVLGGCAGGPGGVDGRRRRAGRAVGPTGRRRAALAGLRQLRLVPGRRLSRPRRPLPPSRPPTSRRSQGMTITAFPGHAGRCRPLARWRSLTRIGGLHQ